MPYTTDVGDKIGKLAVMAIAGQRKGSRTCECECGNTITVGRSVLTKGAYKCCGCSSSKRPLIIGDRYGRLVVTGKSRSENHRKLWPCLCDCGNTHEATTKSLRGGHTKSCGCIVKKHGRSHSPEYQSWRGAKKRTNSPNNANYRRYGGRGIKMCDRWFYSFENFFADMGERPSPNHTLDRIDCDGHYEPGNCRWATAYTQNQNRREYNTRLTHKGKTQTLAEWSRELGINQTTITQRLYKYGWSVHKTLSTRPKKRSAEQKLIDANGRVLTHGGKTQNLANWSRDTGIKQSTISVRLRMGWSVEQALTTLPNKRRAK